MQQGTPSNHMPKYSGLGVLDPSFWRCLEAMVVGDLRSRVGFKGLGVCRGFGLGV